MSTPRPSRFHRVCHRGNPGSSGAPSIAVQACQQWGRFVLCGVLVLAGSVPVWSAGKAVVEFYRDEQVRRSPMTLTAAKARLFPTKSLATPAASRDSLSAWNMLRPPSDVDGSPAGTGGEAFSEGAFLELANGSLSDGGEKLSLLAGPATDDRFDFAAGGGFPVNGTENLSNESFTAMADGYQASAVPEPSAWACLVCGAAGTLMAVVRRRLR